ncbi:MAG: hypothetical protein ACOC6F_01265 [bacterium]
MAKKKVEEKVTRHFLVISYLLPSSCRLGATTSLKVNGFYEDPFQSRQRPVVCSGCGELADVWLAASATTPGAVEGNEQAAPTPLREADVPRERSPRLAPGLVGFSPSARRIEANQACAIMERVM